MPHYTSKVEQSSQLNYQAPTELIYPGGSNKMKKVSTQNLGTFELEPEEGIDVALHINVGSQQGGRPN